MSPVDRAGPVSEISPSRLYERAGWLSSRDLSFSNRDLGKQAARKSKFFYFAMFASFLEFRARTRSQDLCPFLISETGLKLLIWTQGETLESKRVPFDVKLLYYYIPQLKVHVFDF